MAADEQKTGQKKEGPKENSFRTDNIKRGWLYGLGALALALFIFLAGMAASNHRSLYGWEGGPMMHGDFDESADVMGGRWSDENYLSNGQSRDTGVVTSTNGSSFTLAANGSTTKVITDSSTQYWGGHQVKQNDTVTVFGTISNGTITAAQIIINP